MRTIFLLMVVFSLSYSLEFLESDDGVDYYCSEEYVYAHTTIGDENSELHYIPVVVLVEDKVSKLSCSSFKYWLKKIKVMRYE